MKFSFQNQEVAQNRLRQELLSEVTIRKLITTSCLFVCLGFFLVKTLFFVFETHRVLEKSKMTPKISKAFHASHVLPVLVNLKGAQGPQLARVYVYVDLHSDSQQQELFLSDRELEKHLLFVLSGQSTEVLKNNKKQFEKQIRSQLNTFLTQNFVDEVRLQTEVLN